MVENCPELFEAAQYAPHESDDPPLTERERKWHDYAMRLLADVVRNNPSNLSDFDRNLLQSVQSGVAIGTESTVGVDVGTDKETRANFAQTRRRKIDRLRDFFQRRRR